MAEFRCVLCGGVGPWWYLIRHTVTCSSPDPEWTCTTDHSDGQDVPVSDTGTMES